jgi:hypothetical protein
MTIHTASSLRRTWRRAVRKHTNVDAVLLRMIDGMALHLHRDHRRDCGRIWVLTPNGGEVEDIVALQVIGCPHVVAVGDTLFDGTLSQTYRYVET